MKQIKGDIMAEFSLDVDEIKKDVETTLKEEEVKLENSNIKDRAYDKKLTVSDIEKTPNYVSYLQDTEIFSDDTDRTYNINIVNVRIVVPRVLFSFQIYLYHSEVLFDHNHNY